MTEINYEDIVSYDTPAYKPRKKKWGDRREGRRLRTVTPMLQLVPYIMKERSDSQNFFEDVVDISNIEKYLEKKHKEGFTDMTLLHVILAAYVRIVAEKPGVNRFVAGRRVYARNNVECVMTIKQEMTIESPDTCVKAIFDPRDNIYNVYRKFRRVVKEALSAETGFDDTARVLTKLPRWLMRFLMRILRFLDFHGKLPKSLLNVSPFHGSMVITSMGSLGIPAIYHHLYNFGTLPVFISYGNIFTADAVKRDGSREKHHFVSFKVVTDERICDGYYYASVFKRLKKIFQNPEILDQTLESVAEDVD
jgi:hypothetical protein